MADFDKIEKKKLEEERRHKEGITYLMIIDGKKCSERHMFYGITDNHNYVRYIQELKKNVEVSCCEGGWLILRLNYKNKRPDRDSYDYPTDDIYMLNILTMEKFQLPPLPHVAIRNSFAISSPIMDRSCRVIYMPRSLHHFWSWQLGDTEFFKRRFTHRAGIITDHINYKGKLYCLTTSMLNLIAFDYSDPDLCPEKVISGESLPLFIVLNYRRERIFYKSKAYLVESRDDILLICIGGFGHEVSYVHVFKADLGIGKWVELETFGDRCIFLGSRNNIFSSPATTTLGMKGNAIYWVRTPFNRLPIALRPSNYRRSERHLYMYDIDDKSISMSLMLPIVGNSLFWGSFNNDADKMSEQRERASLIKRRFLYVQKGEATIKSSRRLQIEQNKIHKKTEETVTIGSSTKVQKESFWADLPNDLLLEMFPHLFAGDKVAFRSVCTAWYSISLPSRTTQQFVLPLKYHDFSSPLLMFPYNKAYNPIHGELYRMDFPDIPGAKVRATRDGWLLMEHYENNSTELYFYNPFSKEEILLPSCGAMNYYSVFFSAPPSADCLVVVVGSILCRPTICFKKFEDEGWTFRDVELGSFYFSDCNPIIYKDQYYFLGTRPFGTLLIFNPNKDEVRVFESSKFIYKKVQVEQQYMLESDDGKLIAVFVGLAGSLVHTCEWNVSTNKWEILRSLGNKMLFVSNPLSLCKRATFSGTGNKIYFPRVISDGQILFYSLATRRYHTFEMGTSYSNFSGSKFYPEFNGWFMS